VCVYAYACAYFVFVFVFAGLCLLVCVCFGKPAGACAMNVVVGVEFHLLKLMFGTLTLSCVAMFAWLLAQTVLTSEDLLFAFLVLVCGFMFYCFVMVIRGSIVLDGYWWLRTLSLRNTRWTLQRVSGAQPAARFCGQ